MRRILAVVLTLGLVAAACGDDSGGIFVTPTTGPTTGGDTTTTTSGAATFEYPPEIVQAYIDGCSGSAGEEYCRCTIDEFQARMSLQEFLDLEASGTIETNPTVADIIDVCLRTTTDTSGTTLAGDFTPITDIDTLTDLTITDLEQYWAVELPQSWGVEYTPVSAYGAYLVSEGDVPVCGGPLSEDKYIFNAFYCGLNDTVQWDQENLFIPWWDRYGDFAVALVLAHEWGHAVQARWGFDETLPTIVQELQADCLAGAWTGRVDRGESDVLRLEPGDLEEGMAGFTEIGDQLGSGPEGPNAHGNAFARLSAFFDGYAEGAGFCAGFEETWPPFYHIPFVEGDVVDLPYAQTAPLLIDALETFWSIVYPDVFGEPWDPVDESVPYFPSSGDLPTCGGFAADVYAGNAFYCAAEDFVAWDEEQLFPGLYEQIGDFANGLVLATLWGQAVQSKAGLPTTGVAATLQADCFTGVWTAALTLPEEDNPMGIFLAAGDLKEGIVGFLELSAAPGSEDEASAFQRFQAFKEGFLDGIDACGVDA